MNIDKILDLDKNERVIKRTKRHVIGLIGIYVASALASLLFVALLFVAVSNQESIAGDLSEIHMGLAFGLLLIIVAIFTYIGSYVYKMNELIVTNENIIQVLQFSLFSRQISQLNLAKIQDVSVDQNGIFSNFFGYGTIEIETAGEASNFKFIYTPNPNIVAKTIIEAHEDYVRNHPAGHNTYRL